jgi:dissimilatory sulfite reductase (desulfoviridin) alpha/beta subunit
MFYEIEITRGKAIVEVNRLVIEQYAGESTWNVRVPEEGIYEYENLSEAIDFAENYL